MKKNYEWREGAFIKKLTGGLFTLVMLIGLSGTANAQACTIDNIQGGIASGTLSVFATPGNGLAALFDPAGTGAAGDPGCGVADDYTITSVELAMADASLFGLPGEGLGTLEYTVSIVESVDDTCTIMGAELWNSGTLTEVMADDGFHFVSVPVGLVVTGDFFVMVNTVSWDGAANRSPSVYLWDGVERPDCRQVVITDGGATQTDHGNYFSAPANGWYNVSVVGYSGTCEIILCDDFDDYALGFLGDQAPWWTTWSGTHNNDEDGLVVDDQASSLDNSMYCGDNGVQDILLLLGNLTTGTYSLGFNVYVPTGQEGYFNIQEDEVAGVAWNLEVWFNQDGAAPGVGNFAAGNPDATFDFTHDAWNSIEIVMDLDADLFSFYCNGVPAFEMESYPGSIGAVDIFSGSALNMFYMDDVAFQEAEPLSPCGYPTIICDNFDSYDLGFLGDQAPHWTTWSGTHNNDEDGLVVDDQANSLNNSLYCGDNGVQDILLLLGNQTEGTYSLDMNVYIPADQEGYFNIQEDEVAGVAWNLEVWFNQDGAAPGVGNFAAGNPDVTFDFNHDAWNSIKIVMDLDADIFEFYCNGVNVFKNEPYTGSIGAIDIFSGSALNMFYMDDVIFQTATPLNECGFPTYICDNLDSYDLGFLGAQAAHWSTWSGEFGTDEDGLVVDDTASSAPNSMYIGGNGIQDVLLFLGNKTAGSYKMSFNMFVPTGMEGYYNIQEDEVAGVAWNLEVYFNQDGAAPGVANFPGFSDDTFVYPEDEWFLIEMVIDLDNDLFEYYVNGELVMEMAFAGSIGALNFYSASANISEYFDDFIFQDADPITTSVSELTAVGNFELYPNPNNGTFNIVTAELSGTFNIDMIDLSGRVVYSQQVEMLNNETKVINTNDLNTGVYILRMVDVTTSEIYSTRVSIR